MSGPLLAAAIALMGLVIFWYVQDETTRGGQGKSGFLGMSDKLTYRSAKAPESKWRRSTSTRPWRTRRD